MFVQDGLQILSFLDGCSLWWACFPVLDILFLQICRRRSKGEFLGIRAENHLDRQSVVGFFPLGSYSAPFGSKPPFLAVSGRCPNFRNQFLELRAENHLDRQSVVGFFPLGSYSAPFGSKSVFLAVSGRCPNFKKVSFWHSGLRTI